MNMNTITSEIAKLTLKPGDTLVLKVDEYISLDTAKSLREQLERHIPDGVKVLVLEKSLSLQILEAS